MANIAKPENDKWKDANTLRQIATTIHEGTGAERWFFIRDTHLTANARNLNHVHEGMSSQNQIQIIQETALPS